MLHPFLLENMGMEIYSWRTRMVAAMISTPAAEKELHRLLI
jgi:hypothetical protein